MTDLMALAVISLAGWVMWLVEKWARRMERGRAAQRLARMERHYYEALEKIGRLEAYADVDLMWQQMQRDAAVEYQEIEEGELWKTDPDGWRERHGRNDE